jgi:transcriptional regulator with PAS, ATPase and Fis domain
VGQATPTIEEANASDLEADLPTTSDGDSLADAAGALRLVRDIHAAGAKLSGRRRQQVLEKVRSALHAQCVALLASQNDDVIIEAVTGSLPENTAIELAARSYSATNRKWHTMTIPSPSVITICAGRSNRFVAACFSTKPPQSVEELISFVAERVTSEGAGDSEIEPATDLHSTLVLPQEMVIGTSEAMKQLMEQVSATITSRMDVLLFGETGTGKELIARLIHHSGPSRRGPFVAINCAAIPGELLESELFGVQGRVATGVDPRPGLFARANGGTILLDEIGELPERLQPKLLRVLQEREILPLGANAPRKIETRVISASNRNLDDLVAEGKFRPDLYYRLRGLQFRLPPLRERTEDIPALVLEFVRRAAAEHGKVIDGVSRCAMRLLIEHAWPGNIRELQTEIRRAVLICSQRGVLGPEHFETLACRAEKRQQRTTVAPSQPQASPTLRDRVNEMERVEIENALAAAGGNQSKAARLLGITRNGLALKVKRLRIG